MKRLVEVFTSVIESWISMIPGGLGRWIRYRYYKLRLKHLGGGVIIDVGVRFTCPEYVSIHDNTWIDNYVVILAGPPGASERKMRRKTNSAYRYDEGEVVIGRNCHIAMFTVLQGHGGLSIGDNCGVASGSLLYSMSHHYVNPADRDDRTVYKFSPMAPHSEQSLLLTPVVMENSTALGLNSVLLPGATIREGSWVGTGAMVMGEIPPNSIAGGNPAKVLKAIPNRGE